MSEIIDGISVVVVGLLAGNELAIAGFVHPSLWKLNDMVRRFVRRCGSGSAGARYAGTIEIGA